jgi:hypothetical protein
MRGLTTPQDGALQAPHVPGLCLVQLDFDQTIRLCNLGYTYSWNGYDWIGTGALGSIEQINEGADLEAKGVNLTLSGIPSDIIATALGEQYQGRRAQVWYAPLDDAYQIIGAPIRVFYGRIDTMDIEVGETSSITLSAESKLVDWARPRVSRYNHEDQIAKYPDDLGFQYVAKMVEVELIWGRA